MSKEFQRIKEREDVKNQLREFIAHSTTRAVSCLLYNLSSIHRPSLQKQYLERLIELRFTCLRSKFFRSHEVRRFFSSIDRHRCSVS